MSFVKGLCLGLVGFLLFFSFLLFGLTMTAKSTVMQSQFTVKEFGKLDISIATREFLADQMLLDEAYVRAIDRTTVELEPWIRLQLSELISSCYDYWLGKSRTIDITFNLDPLKNSLVNNLANVYLQSPPPDYLALSAVEREQYLAEIRQETLDIIPSTLEIDESDLGIDIVPIFIQIREVMAYANGGFWGLLTGMVIFACLLIIIFRGVKDVLRSFGIILILDGALTILALIVFQNIFPVILPLDLIPELQVWISGMVADVLFPWWVYGLAILAVGFAALAGSFFLNRSARVISGR